MALQAMVGGLLGLLGVVCAVVGIFAFEGISIEIPGIISGALGYYLGLTSQDRRSQILGIVAAVLNVLSMVMSGLSGPPQ
jgi:small-conductance mechanosensitive channel